MGSRVDYDAPGRSCTTMAYTADGTRYIIMFTVHVILLCPDILEEDEFALMNYYCNLLMHGNLRLFSCGTNKEGESFLVEWNESEGAVKRSYVGLGKRSVGVVQFDTTRNKFLAAGDEFVIKFWDMDNVNILTTIDAEGGLPV